MSNSASFYITFGILILKSINIEGMEYIRQLQVKLVLFSLKLQFADELEIHTPIKSSNMYITSINM